MSAYPPGILELAPCRKRCWKAFRRMFPLVGANDELRHAIASHYGLPEGSWTNWTPEQYATAADVFEGLTSIEAMSVYRAVAARQPETPAEITERVAEIEEELRELAQGVIRLQWLIADRLAELWSLAKVAGFRPMVELARFARIVGLKLPTAGKWVQCSRLIGQVTRARHPDLSWSAMEVAANLGWSDEQPATPEAVAHRLEEASDRQLTGIGLAALILGERPKKRRRPGAEVAREILRENVSPAAFQEVDASWPAVTGSVAMSAREVAP